jgi:hypothetical protein
MVGAMGDAGPPMLCEPEEGVVGNKGVGVEGVMCVEGTWLCLYWHHLEEKRSACKRIEDEVVTRPKGACTQEMIICHIRT